MRQTAWNAAGVGNGVAGLAERGEALRQAAALPGADPAALLDAAFAELDGAVELLARRADGEEPAGLAESDERLPDALAAERRLLRMVFQQAPVPLFVLERDGTVRRANAAAGDLIDAPPGYATGRPLAAFLDLSSRAVVQSQVAAAARTGAPRRAPCAVRNPAGAVTGTLAVHPVELADGQRLLIAALFTGPLPPAGTAGTAKAAGKTAKTPQPQPHPRQDLKPDPQPDPQADLLADALRAMTRRMDTVTAVTRLLLDNSTFSEAVTLQRCARLLAGEIASWVIVDVERDGRLRRQLVIGPDKTEDELIRRVRRSQPVHGTLPDQVRDARRPALLTHADDTLVLGTDAEGTHLLMLLGATSLLSVPIADDGVCYGTVTLARTATEGQFAMPDLALMTELGEHLGVAIRVDRMFRHRSAVAEALQASLLPATLPEVPGLDLSAAYLPAGEGLDVSGDFYDVFPMPGNIPGNVPGKGATDQATCDWALTIGDVCGKGQEAAAMTAAARHAIRVLARYNADPADVLAKVNENLLTGGYEDRFVTAKLGCLSWDGPRLRVTLASAGHPGPAVVRSDGRVVILGGGGMPLGLFPDAGPKTQTLRLRPGDMLFFFSDGVTEARDAEGGYFETRLADELAALAGRSAAETARAIQAKLVSFTAGELRDDVSILVARVTGPPDHSS
jgi:serine phosphatase RsbU (regulator of sigma subunit)/PAS domain-containing protein